VTEKGVLEYEALRRLSQQRQMLEKFFGPSETSAEVVKALRMSPEVAQRVKEIVTGVQLQAPEPLTEPPADSAGSTAVRTEADAANKFLNASFAQLRHAYVTLLVMSIVTFVLGIAFLVLAAIQTFTGGRDPAEVAVVAGVGLVQLVILFLRNPLRDIERAAAKAQQARIAIMGYMLTVGLIGESVYGGTDVARNVDRLDSLTAAAIARLRSDVATHQAVPDPAVKPSSGSDPRP
jgi:hypothetical protein